MGWKGHVMGTADQRIVLPEDRAGVSEPWRPPPASIFLLLFPFLFFFSPLKINSSWKRKVMLFPSHSGRNRFEILTWIMQINQIYYPAELEDWHMYIYIYLFLSLILHLSCLWFHGTIKALRICLEGIVSPLAALSEYRAVFMVVYLPANWG